MDPCTDGLGKPGEEMRARSWELVTADESTIVAKPLLDAIVVEDREGNRCFSDPPCTYESDGFKFLNEPENPFDQSVASNTGPGWWGRWFSRRNTMDE